MCTNYNVHVKLNIISSDFDFNVQVQHSSQLVVSNIFGMFLPSANTQKDIQFGNS